MALNCAEQRTADLSNWIEFFVRGFSASVDKLAREVTILSVVNKDSDFDFSEEDVAIIDYIKNFGSIISRDVEEILNVDERTAQRRIKKLIDGGILVQKGAARSVSYELSTSPQFSTLLFHERQG